MVFQTNSVTRSSTSFEEDSKNLLLQAWFQCRVVMILIFWLTIIVCKNIVIFTIMHILQKKLKHFELFSWNTEYRNENEQCVCWVLYLPRESALVPLCVTVNSSGCAVPWRWSCGAAALFLMEVSADIRPSRGPSHCSVCVILKESTWSHTHNFLVLQH